MLNGNNVMTNSLPKGSIVYQNNNNEFSINGYSFTDNDIEKSSQIIANICFDSSGKDKFESYMNTLSDTGFSPLKTTNLVTPKDWQVGEGFAEAYITAHALCTFPWSNNRDLKNPNSSLTGADLVGYHKGKFAFGEVKTSREKNTPPQVTSKKSDGLNTQLNNLCSNHDLRWVLIQYLFHRQQNSNEYKDACRAYLENKNNFYIFGVLIRCTEPTIDDWKYLNKNLQVHEANKVSLIALYLPVNDGITKLHTCVLSKQVQS